MRTESSISIDATAAEVWATYAEVERWPEWSASIERVEPLDGADLAVERRFRVKQPRFPSLVWQVTALEPGRSWTWCQRTPGSTVLGWHEVESRGAERTLVRQGVDQRGPLGLLVAWLTRRMTRRYVAMEAEGLKARVEQTRRGVSPA